VLVCLCVCFREAKIQYDEHISKSSAAALCRPGERLEVQESPHDEHISKTSAAALHRPGDRLEIQESPARRNTLKMDDSTPLGEEVEKEKLEADEQESPARRNTLTMDDDDDDEDDDAIVVGRQNPQGRRKVVASPTVEGPSKQGMRKDVASPTVEGPSKQISAPANFGGEKVWNAIEQVLLGREDCDYVLMSTVNYKLNLFFKLKNGHLTFVFYLVLTSTSSRSLSIGIESTDAEPKSWELTSGNPDGVLPEDCSFLPILMHSVRHYLKLVTVVNREQPPSLQDVSVLSKTNIIFVDESAKEKDFANHLLQLNCGWERRKKRFVQCEL
jgi:hypothetical protein